MSTLERFKKAILSHNQAQKQLELSRQRIDSAKQEYSDLARVECDTRQELSDSYDAYYKKVVRSEARDVR